MRSLAAVAVLLAVGASPVSAAPAPKACRLVTDPANDTYLLRPHERVTPMREDALDVVSIDVASDARTVAVGVRVTKLARTAESSPGGVAFRVQFRADPMPATSNLYFEARADLLEGDVFVVGRRDMRTGTTASIGTAQGVFDTARNEVRMWAPVSQFAADVRLVRGSRIRLADLDQSSSRRLVGSPAGSVATFADTATGSATYVVGTPSCLSIGR